MDFTAIAKSDFNFGGMNIHIHTGWVHLQVQHIDGLALAMQHVFIGTACAVGNDFIANKTAVDISELLVGAGARCIWRAGTPANMNRTRPEINVDGGGNKIFAQYICQTLVPSRFAWVASPLLDDLAFVPNGKTNLGPGQGVASDSFNAMGQFCIFRF